MIKFENLKRQDAESQVGKGISAQASHRIVRETFRLSKVLPP